MKIIEFNKKCLNSNGLVEIIKGDTFREEAKIVDTDSNSEIVNLSDSGYTSATAFFKGSSSNISSEITLGTDSLFEVHLPASGTSSLQKNTTGTEIFIVAEKDNGEQKTFFTKSQSIGVYDRDFNRLI